MDDLYKLTDYHCLLNLNVQRLQVLTQMPVLNAEHFPPNETSFNGANCRHSTGTAIFRVLAVGQNMC